MLLKQFFTRFIFLKPILYKAFNQVILKWEWLGFAKTPYKISQAMLRYMFLWVYMHIALRIRIASCK
jgi:hypothetical protein